MGKLKLQLLYCSQQAKCIVSEVVYMLLEAVECYYTYYNIFMWSGFSNPVLGHGSALTQYNVKTGCQDVVLHISSITKVRSGHVFFSPCPHTALQSLLASLALCFFFFCLKLRIINLVSQQLLEMFAVRKL